MELLPVLLAFIGSSLLNIGQAIQKMGLALVPASRLRGWALWAWGTLMITSVSFIILFAVSIGSVSLISAMAGSGLASLTLF